MRLYAWKKNGVNCLNVFERVAISVKTDGNVA